ncbi:MAG: hypothetical protein KJ728_11830 [Alphaproteobacteria bacterium]|uniref:DUF7146 domain-containing protein n=1 Tax=viral metagenome TaxID=1070528 RepID=A0A6M3XBW3_9ZZZZ|nr:hypothetical protein [Alphaproteobacteria bacterium]
MNAPNIQGRPPEISVREISALLASQIQSLCASLGLKGHVIQGALVPRNPTRNDKNPGSFVINLTGQRQGKWDEYATGEFGDALDLVAYIHFGRVDRVSQREAVIWAKRFLGIGDHRHMDPAHARKLAKAREAMEIATERAEGMALANRDKDRRRCQAMFLGAQPLEPGTPGWRYLREARCVPLEQMRMPWAVRSHPGMRHVETDRIVPCLISAMLFPDGSFGAVHRVFLEPDGSDQLQEAKRLKLPVKKIWPKGWHGALIPISRGKTGLSPREAVKKGLTEENALGEGVEDGFTVAWLTPEWRVSGVGASANFAHVEPPASASAVIAIRDRDPDRKVMAGVTKKVAELQAKAEARDLPFLESWPERGFKDFNDMIRGVRS